MFVGPTTNSAWTNQLKTLAFMFDLVTAIRIDLTGRRMIRLSGLVMTAGAAGSKLILRYRTSYSATTTDYSDFSSEVSIPISATGHYASAWIPIPTGAQGDVYLTLLGSGGNSTADPLFRAVYAEVH